MARAWVWRVLSLVQPGRQEEGLPRCSSPDDAPFRVQAHRVYKGYASFQFKKKSLSIEGTHFGHFREGKMNV